ncbi:hypothetical protein Hanom_Chr07g00621361 [Helianthus anomalus]
MKEVNFVYSPKFKTLGKIEKFCIFTKVSFFIWRIIFLPPYDANRKQVRHQSPPIKSNPFNLLLLYIGMATMISDEER